MGVLDGIGKGLGIFLLSEATLNFGGSDFVNTTSDITIKPLDEIMLKIVFRVVEICIFWYKKLKKTVWGLKATGFQTMV